MAGPEGGSSDSFRSPGRANCERQSAEEPNDLSALFLVELNRAPISFLVDFGSFDSTGGREVAGPVPPFLSGVVLDFQAFQLTGQGDITASTTKRVGVR